jgi:EpsI family protein
MGYGVFVIVLGGVLASVSALRRFWPESPLAPNGHPFDDNPDREWPARPTTPMVGDDLVETPVSLARERASLKKECSVGAVTRVDPTDRKLVLAERSAEIAKKRVIELETAEGVGGAAAARYEGASAVLSPTRVVGVASVVLLAIAEMFFLRTLADAPPRGGVGVVLAADGQNPIDLPAFVGSDWIGQRADVSAVERETLPADTGFSRRNYAFVADRKHDVFLSIVVSGRDRTSIHRPELCLVGQGWTIEAATRRTFRYAGAGDATASEFPASVLQVRREIATSRGKIVVPQLVGYWFVGGDTVVSSHWKRFAIDAWNRVTRGRTDRWAYVLVQTDATDGEAAALARMQTILDGTLPVFQRRLPAR